MPSRQSPYPATSRIASFVHSCVHRQVESESSDRNYYADTNHEKPIGTARHQSITHHHHHKTLFVSARPNAPSSDYAQQCGTVQCMHACTSAHSSATLSSNPHQPHGQSITQSVITHAPPFRRASRMSAVHCIALRFTPLWGLWCV